MTGMNVNGISDQYLAMMMQDISKVPDLPKSEVFTDDETLSNDITKGITKDTTGVRNTETYKPSGLQKSDSYGLYSNIMDVIRERKSHTAGQEEIPVQSKPRELEDISTKIF